MATYLQTVCIGPDMVRLVDHPGGEPQDLAFQFLQMAQVLMQHVNLRWWPLDRSQYRPGREARSGHTIAVAPLIHNGRNADRDRVRLKRDERPACDHLLCCHNVGRPKLGIRQVQKETGKSTLPSGPALAKSRCCAGNKGALPNKSQPSGAEAWGAMAIWIAQLRRIDGAGRKITAGGSNDTLDVPWSTHRHP
jgi:hypothetical protein